jgi:hypothetical protein
VTYAEIEHDLDRAYRRGLITHAELLRLQAENRPRCAECGTGAAVALYHRRPICADCYRDRCAARDAAQALHLSPSSAHRTPGR